MARILVVYVWVVVALGLTGCGAKWDPKAFNAGAPAGTGFEYRDLPGSDRKYGVFIPHDYDGTRAYPAVVFLHGLFENGSDPKSSMLVGLGPVVAERKLAAGYIIVFPQARSDWRSKDELLLAKRVLEDVKAKYRVDVQRVTLTGVSTGGYGVWALAQMYPNEFSALVPMAAFDKIEAIPVVKHIPTWIWHNSGDVFVSAGNAKSMYKGLKAAGADVRMTMNDSRAHNVWVAAYRDPAFWQWVGEQRRGG